MEPSAGAYAAYHRCNRLAEGFVFYYVLQFHVKYDILYPQKISNCGEKNE